MTALRERSDQLEQFLARAKIFTLDNGTEISVGTENKVMSPSPLSFFLANYLSTNVDFEGKKVFDMGTGTGFQAIVAALGGAALVFTSDINTQANDVVTQNAMINNISKIMLLKPGSSYEPLGDEKVDIIISNPAQLPMPSGDNDSPYFAGPDGKNMINSIVEGAATHLETGGQLIMTHKSLTNIQQTIDRLRELGFDIVVNQDGRLTYMPLEFRDFYPTEYIQQLAKQTNSPLFIQHDGRYFEVAYIIHAIKR